MDKRTRDGGLVVGGLLMLALLGSRGALVAGGFSPGAVGPDMTLSVDGRTLTATGWNNNVGQMARSSTVKSAGKWYVEFVLLSDGNIQVPFFGFATAAASLALFLGSDAGGWSCQGNNTSGTNANLWHAGASGNEPPLGKYSHSNPQPQLAAIDIDAGQMWFGPNNTFAAEGGVFNPDPATGTDPTFTFAPGTPMYFAATVGTTDPVGSPCAMTVCDRASQQANAPPAGFQAWTKG